MKKRALCILSAFLALAAFAADLQAQPGVTGSVVGPDGKPFAAATVELMPFLPGFSLGRLRLDGGEVQPAAAAATDQHGRFALTAPKEGMYRVRVSAPGRMPMQSGLLPLAEETELPPVALPEDAGLSLQLKDSQGRPAAGVWVFAEPARGAGKPQRLAAWQPEIRIRRSDKDGRIVLPRFAGERLAVTWFETGTAARGTQVLEGPETVALPAPSGAWRQIKAVDPEGRALAGLLLRAGPQAWPVGLTDEQGGFRIAGWPEQSLELRVTDSQGFSFSQTASVPEGQPVTLAVPVPSPFSGRIYDADSGKPLAGALVWPVSDPGLLVRSGADGRFQHRAPEPGTFWLEAVAPSYLSKRIPVSPAQMSSGRGPAIALTRAQRIRGQVVDAAGAPVPGAWIAAELENPGDRPPSSGAETAADGGASDDGGAFELRRLRPGLGYALRVQKPGYLPAAASAVPPGSLKITLQPSPRASGEVRDVQGLPVAGAEVEIAPRSRRSRPEEREVLRAATDKQGRFTFAELPSIEVDLTVRKAGFAEAAFRGLQLPAGRPAVDLGKIVLRPGAAVRGRVLDSRKRPVDGARIYQVEDLARIERLAAALAEEEPEARSSGRGDFVLEDRPAGSAIHLLVLAEGYRPEPVRGARVPSPEPLTVTLADAFAMQGRVLDEDGEPVKGARVEIAWQETVPDVPGQLPAGRELSQGGTTDGEGRFDLAGLPAGESEITILAEGFLPLERQKLVLPPAEPAAPPTFVLGRGAALEGRVTAGDGIPVRGARISAGTAGAALSDDEGFYAVAGVAPGETEIELSHLHYPDQRQRQTLTAGLNRLDFQLPAGQEVRGQVLDEQRNPVPGARVLLRLGARIGYREYRAQSGHDGGFKLSPVADGRYVLEASAQEYAEGKARKPVVVSGEPVDGLEVILPRGADLVGRATGLDREDLWRLRIQATGEDGRSHPAKLDTDGRYELRALSLGSWQVKAVLGDGERQAQARAELRQGGEVVERDLEFADRLRLTGRVLFADEPLPAARVALRAGRLAVERAVLTDHDGRFELEDLEPDDYWLGVSHARKLVVYNGKLTLAADRDLVLDLEGVNVQGVVVDAATDRPVANAVVSLEHQPGPDTSEFVIASSTDESGAFLLPRVPPGRYRLRGRAEGYVAGEEGIDIPAQEELSGVRLALTPTPGLEVVARLASGRVPPVVHFRALSGAQALAGSQVPDAKGRIRLPTPSQGSWRLLIGAPGCGTVEVAAQSPGPPVSVVLPPAARLAVQVPDLATADVRAEVTVLGPDGSPVPVLGPGGALRQTWPMVGGRTTIEDLPAGTWIVGAASGDGRRWSMTVVAPGAASVPVILE